MEEKEILFLNAFNAIPGVGAATLRALKKHFGSYEAAWRAPLARYADVALDTQARAALLQAKPGMDPEREMRRVLREELWMITEGDAAYPPLLAEIHTPPAILYGKGAKEALASDHSIAVVGTRRPTPYGIEATEAVVAGLTAAGVAVISGLATGIDTKAHRTALERRGTTVAVLGSGIDPQSLFPPENRTLADRIAASGGAVISEYAPGTPAVKEHFPLRNRIIAGLAHGALVVEARERSGALITARLAMEENRDVFAILGSIFSPTSAGPNALIQQGAKAVARAEDILEELGIDHARTAQTTETESLNEKERALLALLEHPRGIDDLCAETQFPVPVILATLSVLELKRLIRGLGGDVFQKV